MSSIYNGSGKSNSGGTGGDSTGIDDTTKQKLKFLDVNESVQGAFNKIKSDVASRLDLKGGTLTGNLNIQGDKALALTSINALTNNINISAGQDGAVTLAANTGSVTLTTGVGDRLKITKDGSFLYDCEVFDASKTSGNIQVKKMYNLIVCSVAVPKVTVNLPLTLTGVMLTIFSHKPLAEVVFTGKFLEDVTPPSDTFNKPNGASITLMYVSTPVGNGYVRVM